MMNPNNEAAPTREALVAGLQDLHDRLRDGPFDSSCEPTKALLQHAIGVITAAAPASAVVPDSTDLAARAFNIPAGFALVPLEPTTAMFVAAMDCDIDGGDCTVALDGGEVLDVWGSMLAAAPAVDAVPDKAYNDFVKWDDHEGHAAAAVPGEPVGVVLVRVKDGVRTKRPELYDRHKELAPGTLLYAAAPAAAACQHRIADARNPMVKDGYLCVDCGALFRAADHGSPSREAAE